MGGGTFGASVSTASSEPRTAPESPQPPASDAATAAAHASRNTGPQPSRRNIVSLPLEDGFERHHRWNGGRDGRNLHVRAERRDRGRVRPAARGSADQPVP